MIKPAFLALISALLLAGCVTARSSVKDIGSGRNDYKESPCACGPVIQIPNTRSLS